MVLSPQLTQPTKTQPMNCHSSSPNLCRRSCSGVYLNHQRQTQALDLVLTDYSFFTFFNLRFLPLVFGLISALKCNFVFVAKYVVELSCLTYNNNIIELNYAALLSRVLGMYSGLMSICSKNFYPFSKFREVLRLNTRTCIYQQLEILFSCLGKFQNSIPRNTRACK